MSKPTTGLLGSGWGGDRTRVAGGVSLAVVAQLANPANRPAHVGRATGFAPECFVYWIVLYRLFRYSTIARTMIDAANASIRAHNVTTKSTDSHAIVHLVGIRTGDGARSAADTVD